MVLGTAILTETYDHLGRKVWRYVITSGPHKDEVFEFHSLEDALDAIDDFLRSGTWNDYSEPSEDDIAELMEVLSTIWVDPNPPANP